MSLARQFVDVDAPPKPAVRPVDRAPPAAAPVSNVAAEVRRPAPNTMPVVRQVAEPSEPLPIDRHECRSKVTVRASKETWNQYHAELMRRRRSAAKLDAVELATVDA
jgi:hypothetical protein